MSHAYRVLARAYRPQTFAELVGQEALVRTLTNAIHSNRLAHAYLFTGIRGVGKTTTARILAKALNCIGDPTLQGPTPNPCGVCDNCRAIAEDRHVDVLEMDAASHTGVDDIRNLIETVHYMPVAGRFKVYIIDEVHMLSTSAFNALLKTLEEPPPHVIFIFATTEIRKIPVTILSRCQRFDLRRVPDDRIIQHLRMVCDRERVTIDAEALLLMANAAEGSVRDSLSLLDQAIALSPQHITASVVQEMLGLADRGQVFDLLEDVLSGGAAQALARLTALYDAGADPVQVLQDALDVTHHLSRLKVAPDAEHSLPLPEHLRHRAGHLSAQSSMAVLTRLWQMLLKGIQEVKMAPNPLAAAEMVIVRIAYAADMPTPAEMLDAGPALVQQPTHPVQPQGGGMPQGGGGQGAAVYTHHAPRHSGNAQPAQAMEPETATLHLIDFEALVRLFEQQREPLLAARLKQDVRVVSFGQGKLEIQATPDLPLTFVRDIGTKLSDWTNRRWVVVLSNNSGGKTLREQELENQAQRRQEAELHPVVISIKSYFPGADIVEA
jgi:DNA polymerase-3 subunit gamma/tau